MSEARFENAKHGRVREAAVASILVIEAQRTELAERTEILAAKLELVRSPSNAPIPAVSTGLEELIASELEVSQRHLACLGESLASSRVNLELSDMMAASVAAW